MSSLNRLSYNQTLPTLGIQTAHLKAVATARRDHSHVEPGLALTQQTFHVGMRSLPLSVITTGRCSLALHSTSPSREAGSL